MGIMISVNGQEREVQARDIAALVVEMDLDARKVAVELNMAIVPRSLHTATPLSEGDRLEIVQFVGGG